MKSTTGPLIIGKNSPAVGKAPAVICIDPKYAANVGAIQRAASCFNIHQVWFTGNRIKLEEGERLPREERMKGYRDVDLIQYDYPFDHFKGCTPVCMEVGGPENLFDFEHPDDAVYVFGPEDGGVDQMSKRFCHRFVKIPTAHCTNLAAAVYITLYDRAQKIYKKTGVMPQLEEHRGYLNDVIGEACGVDFKGVAFA